MTYKHKDLILEIKKPVRDEEQLSLLETEEDWRKHWWNMPEFSFENTAPKRRIVVNFLTDEDVEEFKRAIDQRFSDKANSLWFPHRERLENGKYSFGGPKTGTKYPVCIPSKGRHDVATTGKKLAELGVSFKFFVEQHEGELYAKHMGEENVVVMPFSNLGQGSIPARNFIWEWCKERGHARHWLMDDNIKAFYRLHCNRRLRVTGGGIFRAMEDFVDRYENIAIAGPHHIGFVSDNVTKKPFLLNTRVYSCSLIKTDLDYRWRGRYNEDTDLCLRMLKDGYCSVVFNALLMVKGATAYSKGQKGMKGGNTDNVYNTGDHRLAFAQSLVDQHPDVARITWKFNRWHHEVDYSPFKRNKLVLKSGVTPTAHVNNYDMELMAKWDPEYEITQEDCDEQDGHDD